MPPESKRRKLERLQPPPIDVSRASTSNRTRAASAASTSGSGSIPISPMGSSASSILSGAPSSEHPLYHARPVPWTDLPPAAKRSNPRSGGRKASTELSDNPGPSGPRTPGGGDNLILEGYSNVRIISQHYDDTVLCRAISHARGDRPVFVKLSLSAQPSAAAQFKAEAALLSSLYDSGVHNVSRILAREAGRLGVSLASFFFWGWIRSVERDERELA